MTFYQEIVNFEICDKLSQLTLTQFTELFNKSTTKRHNEYNISSEYSKLKNYCSSYLKNYKQNIPYNVEYGYPKNKTIGRLQSKTPSLQRLYNGFRGVLQNDITYDLDMKNCHPNILLGLCKENNIKHTVLYNYIQNREAFLQEIANDLNINRSEAKSLILKSLNKVPLTTQHNNKKIKSKLFIEFDKETSEITQQIYNIIKNDDEYKKYDISPEWNYQGKLVNLLLCEKENEYLQMAINYLNEKNIKISTLMFDGLMVYKNDNYDINNVIDDLNNIFKNINIEWDIKKHNIELEEDILNMEINNIKSFQGNDIIEIGDYLLNDILKDKLYLSDGSYYFLRDDKIIQNHINNIKEIERELYKIIIRQDLYMKYTVKKNEDGEDEPVYMKVSNNTTKINELIKHCLNCCPVDNNFIDNIWRYTQFKIFFNNGYYDFEKNKFIYGKFNKTFIKIDRDYIQTNNENIRKQIYNKVLNPVFSIDDEEKDKTQKELLNYFLYSLSHIIAGDVERKRFIVFQGLRNSGKGVISSLIENCFGKYIKTTNSGNFEFKKNINDEAKALSWVLDFQFSRLAITQEINLSDNNKINGNAIKKFTGGMDSMQVRKNFKDEVEIKIQSGLMICCNDMPEIQPTDTYEFMDEFQMKSKFIDDDYDGIKLNGFKYYKKDNFIKSKFLNNDDVINEFINIILESYNKEYKYPKEIKIENDNNNDDNDYEKLFNLFDFNCPDGRITNKELMAIVKNNNIPFTIKKAKMLLKTKGCEEYKNNNIRGLKNLQIKTLDDEE